jgi:bleomycin hydrolase
MSEEFQKTESHKALQNAICNNDIYKLALNRESFRDLNTYFNHQVHTEGISNQKSSGRCWMYTGLNVMRVKVIEKYKLDEFHFSHNYLFFYDQLEKVNLFFKGMIETAFMPMNDREAEWLLKNPIGD